jgi:putative phosphoesterase
LGVYKILAVSDTHVPTIAQRLPEKIFDEAQSCQLMIHAGDVVSRETLNLLSSKKRTAAVRGNMDFPDLASKLPVSRVIQEGKWRIGITHGHIGRGRDTPERAASIFPHGTVDCVVFGHSHIQMRETRDGVLLFNPGSPTAGRGGFGNSFGILELGKTIQARFVQSA